MSKRRKLTPKRNAQPSRKTPGRIKNSKDAMANGLLQSAFGSSVMASPFANGLTEAIMGFNPTVAGGAFGPTTLGTPVTQVNTLQLNLRWYFVSNFRQLLSQAYCEKGIIKTVCDVPVNDAFRGGIDVKTKQLSADEIEHLKNVQKRQGDWQKLKAATIWKRLFGGAGLICNTNQDPTTPFKIKLLKQGEPVKFIAVDMWELFFAQQNTDDYAEAIDDLIAEPVDPNVEFYDYYDETIHYTRVLKMMGMQAPSFLRPRLRGWGLSVVETVIDALNQYLKATSLMFEVLDEFKVDVYKIRNFASTLLSDEGTNAVRKRLMLANQQKNFFNALTMDSEDDFIQKELSFAGLAETQAQIRMQLASEVRMPMSKLFGIGSTGFNSGEDDIENYNGMVESDIRVDAERDVLWMTAIRCQQQFGFVPDDLTVAFKPLRVLSTLDEENVKTQRYSRLKTAADSGYCTVKEFQEGCNADNLLPIRIDTTGEKLDVMGTEGSENEEVPNPVKKLPKPEGVGDNRKPPEAK